MQDASPSNGSKLHSPSTELDKKKQSLRRKSTHGLTPREREEAREGLEALAKLEAEPAPPPKKKKKKRKRKPRQQLDERVTNLVPDFDKDSSLVDSITGNLGDLESAQAFINEQLVKVSATLLTDISPQNELEAEKDMFKAIRNACKRAGMLDGGTQERDFFKIIYDPKLQQAVRQIGKALVGLNILPLMAVAFDEAFNKRNVQVLGWLFEIAELKRDKYQFALDRRQVVNINAGNEYNVSFEDKSDEELERLANGLHDVTEAEVITS